MKLQTFINTAGWLLVVGLVVVAVVATIHN